MLKLLHSLGSLLLTGVVLGGLVTVPASTTPPHNAPLTVPDVMFYGTATLEGQALESGTVQAVLPRGGRISTGIAPVSGTDYNYSLAVPLNLFDDPQTADLPADAVATNDVIRFTINGDNAFYQNASGLDIREFTVPRDAMGETYILDLMIASDDDYMMGDVNVNGYRDVADALLMMRYGVGFVAGDEEFPPAPGKPYLPLCDVVVDGLCNANDALRILQCDVGLPGVPCLPAPSPVITLTQSEESLAFRLEVVSDSGQTLTRTVQVVANEFEPILGAASLEVHYDTAQVSVASCVAAQITEMNAGVCYAAPDAGSARLNYAAVNGINPEVVLAELTFTPVGGYDLEQLAQDLDLQINSAFDLEGESFAWPETPPPPSLDNILFLPLVMQSG
jgi:hypothetical protein